MLENKVKNLGQNTTPKNYDFDIINEITDRQYRANNIIIFNLRGEKDTSNKSNSEHFYFFHFKSILHEMILNIEPILELFALVIFLLVLVH